MKVLAFGEVLWDFINGDKFFGGAPVNFAAHVVQCGEEAGIVTALGTERLGDQALEQIRNAGISDEFVQRVEDRVTGRVMVLLNDGQPTYRIKKDVAYDYVDKAKIDLRSVAKYDAFYFGTLAQRSAQSREALYYILRNAHFKTVFYDVNLRRESYSKEVIETSLKCCTVLKMNEDEITVLTTLLYGINMLPKLFIGRLMQDYPQIHTVLVTAGSKGCSIYTATSTCEVASDPIVVKDTVGAGDAFCAAFLTTFMRTGDPKKAARIGNMVGGFVASESGAIPGYPIEFKRKIGILTGMNIVG